MSEGSISIELRIKRIQKHISRMPSLSTTVTKVLEICNNPTTSPNDLNRVISLDPVLTGKVLRLINSAYYSLADKVTSLTRAIIMLGINTVKNLALSTAVLESIGTGESTEALSVDEFWTHSICVGVTAKTIATINGIPAGAREEYFVAGLLHDLGKIPLNDRFPQEYSKVLQLAKKAQGSLHEAENIVLGIDHCAVGKMIADKWQLGEAIDQSLIYHHHIDGKVDGKNQLIDIVGLANIYANLFEIGSSGDPFPGESEVTYFLDKVGIDWGKLTTYRETVLEEIEKANIFLKVSNKG